MKTRYLFVAMLTIALVAATSAWADENYRQFTDHDRQVTRDWYNQHQNHPPRGLRSEDRFNADQESRFEAGRPFDREMRHQAHSLPRDLRRELPTPPRHYTYVTVGGHVALVDSSHHILRDVIHLHEGSRP